MAGGKSDDKAIYKEKRKADLTMKIQHIISTRQFLQKNYIDEIFALAERFRKLDDRNKLSPILRNKLLAAVFYEPSTRTRFSFESAMLKLGGEVVSTESAGQFSSAIKGESLEDTIRIITDMLM